MRIRARALLVVLATAAALTACGGGSATPSSSAPADSPITVSDAWVKSTDGMMTAVFARISNSSSSEVAVTSAKTSLSDVTELHEMVMKDGQMIMQPKQGGFAIPANGAMALEPGGSHIMVLDLMAPVKVGDQATVTLVLSSGSSVTFTAVAKEFSGGNESYNPTGESMSMSMSPSMSMG